ncbi:uncharacterized protein B0P05DRAFT_545854 [Gilbertella persicaria]|uniref:uncharacterized protein n=1 Tax=Gilbertella persicaria TaxID=101096 RepID=UPI00221E4D03|nr:uncharacterized protein B0P05DRAFT_545854 [Gilbertella persicaria]KAI8076432.1 hypothetical protein B0P05DRAFT_545854 [Gilbertella persicaria]
MKFLALVLFTAVASAQITAPTRNYNVTSPVSNGPYVVGQILPCTYRLFSDVDSSALNLQIDLVPTAPAIVPAAPSAANTSANTTINATSTTITVAATADVSKTDAFIKREGNLTYYEHSINFNIPSTVKPGNYHVVFFDKATNTKLPIPIEIRPAAAPTSAGPKATLSGLPGRPQSSGSIFAQGAGASTASVSKALVALFGVASLAFLL